MEYKGYNLSKNNVNLTVIKPIKGALPKALAGTFSEYGRARSKIDEYLMVKELEKQK